MEHEVWLTAILNKYLSAPAETALAWVGIRPEVPGHPWSDYVSMEILVAVVIVMLFALLRLRLSMDRPGKLQHCCEMIYGFLHGQTDDTVGHAGRPYLAFFGTLFIFILFSNLLGLIPTLESPTMFPPVPLGCAVTTFLFYNWLGVRKQGPLNYLKHFAGPTLALAPLMVPIEIISHLARMLSLTVRLYANMFAGEQVTVTFMMLVPIVIPLPFMGLHIFVGLIQAYIFTLLAMVYVSGAIAHEH